LAQRIRRHPRPTPARGVAIPGAHSRNREPRGHAEAEWAGSFQDDSRGESRPNRDHPASYGGGSRDRSNSMVEPRPSLEDRRRSNSMGINHRDVDGRGRRPPGQSVDTRRRPEQRSADELRSRVQSMPAGAPRPDREPRRDADWSAEHPGDLAQRYPESAEFRGDARPYHGHPHSLPHGRAASDGAQVPHGSPRGQSHPQSFGRATSDHGLSHTSSHSKPRGGPSVSAGASPETRRRAKGSPRAAGGAYRVTAGPGSGLDATAVDDGRRRSPLHATDQHDSHRPTPRSLPVNIPQEGGSMSNEPSTQRGHMTHSSSAHARLTPPSSARSGPGKFSWCVCARILRPHFSFSGAPSVILTRVVTSSADRNRRQRGQRVPCWVHPR
jgi:hypothetical protein